MRSRISAVALAALLALGGVACSDDGADTTDPAGAVEEEAPAAEEAPAGDITATDPAVAPTE
ncbi:hypothetical protein [Euzebya sp.]|uniref:hypothetical protein n=1 Tax=Euzebya sp. TaxID=1971409 RepID=UPI0035124A70